MCGKRETRSSLDRDSGQASNWSSLGRVAAALATVFHWSAGYGPAFAQASLARPEPSKQVNREWVDPCLGSRWQLVLNSAHPSWPGRVMLVDASGGGSSVRASKHLPSKAGSAGTRGTGWAAVSTQADLSLPVIRAGDQVVVDQRSTVIQARFQAVALESARMGEKLRVRLSTGGNAQNTSRSAVIAVRAIGAGQAQWQDPNETEP
jgi:hypothetical protein